MGTFYSLPPGTKSNWGDGGVGGGKEKWQATVSLKGGISFSRTFITFVRWLLWVGQREMAIKEKRGGGAGLWWWMARNRTGNICVGQGRWLAPVTDCFFRGAPKDSEREWDREREKLSAQSIATVHKNKAGFLEKKKKKRGWRLFYENIFVVQLYEWLVLIEFLNIRSLRSHKDKQ